MFQECEIFIRSWERAWNLIPNTTDAHQMISSSFKICPNDKVRQKIRLVCSWGRRESGRECVGLRVCGCAPIRVCDQTRKRERESECDYLQFSFICLKGIKTRSTHKMTWRHPVCCGCVWVSVSECVWVSVGACGCVCEWECELLAEEREGRGRDNCRTKLFNAALLRYVWDCSLTKTNNG